MHEHKLPGKTLGLRSEAHKLQLLKPVCLEPVLHNNPAPHLPQLKKAACANNESLAQPVSKKEHVNL